MQKIIYSILVLSIFILSCKQKSQEKPDNLQPPEKESSSSKINEPFLSGGDLTYQVIPGENGSGGFGYDIFMKGKLYVHQPTIPAVQGNKTFSTEQKAKQAAELVIYKIQHNILPPTVEIRELDSLHLLE